MKRRRWLLSGALVILTTFLTLAVEAQLLEQPGPVVGYAAPAFSALAANGGQVSLGDYKGKVVLLQFWASWCSVCVEDMPQLRTLYDKYSANGFTIVGISLDEDRVAFEKKVAEHGISWAQIIDGKGFDGEVARLFGVRRTPTYHLIGRSGRIAATNIGAVGLDRAVAGELARPAPGSMSARDQWQRPDYVLDELEVGAGSVVGDVGAGDGYFSMHMARRVGSQGKVYAVDISEPSLDTIRARAAQQGFNQIVTVLGASAEPRLPEQALDAILVVNAYHEMKEFDQMLRGMHRALKPGGLLAIIDASAEPGHPREKYAKDHNLPEDLVREDALRNGFTFYKKAQTLQMSGGSDGAGHGHDWYFVIFKK